MPMLRPLAARLSASSSVFSLRRFFAALSEPQTVTKAQVKHAQVKYRSLLDEMRWLIMLWDMR